MTHDNRVNVKLSDSQLNKLKSATKNETRATLRLSSNMVSSFNNDTKFPRKLLLTSRQVTNLCKAFTNKSSANKKLSKTQISKIMQSGGLLGRLLGLLKKVGLPLIKNVLQTLPKSVLILLGLTGGTLAADAEIHKKILVRDVLWT